MVEQASNNNGMFNTTVILKTRDLRRFAASEPTYCMTVWNLKFEIKKLLMLQILK